MVQERHCLSCLYALYMKWSHSCPGLSFAFSPWLLLSVCEVMIHESGSGFWEKTWHSLKMDAYPVSEGQQSLTLQHLLNSSAKLFSVFKTI